MFLGSGFILVAILMGTMVFATAGKWALKFFEFTSNTLRDMLQSYMERGGSDGGNVAIPLHQQTRIQCISRIIELSVMFMLYILIGVVTARVFVYHSDWDEHKWTWMETFYFAVQTVTTVGKYFVADPQREKRKIRTN